MLLEDLVNAIKDLFFTLLYLTFALTCKLIDFLKDVFYMLSGISPVEIDGEKSDLLTSLMKSSVINRVFLTVFVIGAVLLVTFTIVAIIKSAAEEKKNVFTVLKKTGEAVVTALIVPFCVLAGILLTNAVMGSMDSAMNAYSSGRTTIGGQLLVTIGADCYTGSGDKSAVMAAFVSGQYDYLDIDLVKANFDIQKMNWLLGLLGSLAMLISFLLSAVTFVQRIFDIVLLYIVSPISVSTIPLDDGNRFKVWKDMMVSKILSAYGIILSMNLFFLIMPQVYRIRFFEGDFQNGVVNVLFLIGGAFATAKASRTISQLCGAQQSGGELMSTLYSIRSGFAMTHTAAAVIGGAVGGLVGGSAYKAALKSGKSKSEAMKGVGKKDINQTAKDPSKAVKPRDRFWGAGARLATMPVGMAHDLASGGLITMGKNFMPRLKNVVAGGGYANHAEVNKPKKPEKPDESPAAGEAKKEDAKAPEAEAPKKETSPEAKAPTSKPEKKPDKKPDIPPPPPKGDDGKK
jgi:hypothetical protein